MIYYSTRSLREKASFEEAVRAGLASDKGLFVPQSIPKLDASFFERIEHFSELEIAQKVMAPYVKGSLNEKQLEDILKKTLDFSLPVVKVKERQYALELFHGPTQAFKDVGARFMANCLAAFGKQSNRITVLVATSGDTGSAVAHGFYEVEGVDICILFPKGKVSAYQESQMTTLGKNIQAIEIDGDFDDCQAMVKQAFLDQELNAQMTLSSANSINVARFLPQMLYYFFAYKQLKTLLKQKKWFVSVPSGNFGNLTAGLYAKAMGLPIDQFIAANNANDPFYRYLKTGKYTPKSTIATYSNAMDVGDPSNFERILQLYQSDLVRIKRDVISERFSDEETLLAIREIYEKESYILDPHGAVGLMALQKHMDQDTIGMFLETAHPNKFEAVVQKALPHFHAPPVDLSKSQKVGMENDFQKFRQWLLKNEKIVS